jgi:hypothetical protein
MNTIPASEVKRRGVAALEEAARKGPVHVIRNNRPVGVYLSEEAYARLVAASGSGAERPRSGVDVWDLILNRPYPGTRTAEEIEAQLREERATWGDR